VKAHRKRHPIVVVSAIGKTTNQLLEMASQASKGQGYCARKTLNDIRDTHFRIADDLRHGARLESVNAFLQNAFLDLHRCIHEMSEEGRLPTSALSDYIASFGERLSSRIVAACLQELMPAEHLDARDFVVTDGHHGSAAPHLWDTYARLRRTLPRLAESSVAVMGGFIGATEDGATTTLGRGGSDLTASLVGAAICAEEIQIWTDVDGILTCDPRVLKGGFRIHSVSYDEATAMASRGAKVLHPDTVKPAIRQRIPLVVRNSRDPGHEGTRIEAVAAACSNPVKTIALKQNLMVLEMTSSEVPTGPELVRVLHDFCFRKNIEPALLCHRAGKVLLGLNSAEKLDELQMELAGCVEVRLRHRVSLMSLIGEGIARDTAVANRALAALRGIDAVVVSDDPSSCILSFLVPQRELRRAVALLDHEFFASVDSSAFSPVAAETPNAVPEGDRMVAFTLRKTAWLSTFGRPYPKSMRVS
jgi:aspartate kinase